MSRILMRMEAPDKFSVWLSSVWLSLDGHQMVLGVGQTETEAIAAAKADLKDALKQLDAYAQSLCGPFVLKSDA